MLITQYHHFTDGSTLLAGVEFQVFDERAVAEHWLHEMGADKRKSQRIRVCITKARFATSEARMLPERLFKADTHFARREPDFCNTA